MWKTIVARAVSFVLGLSFLTACNQKDESNALPASLQESVSLQLQWVTQTQFAGYYVALDKGWYREEGLDLTIKAGGPDISPVDLVSGGISDFGTALLADLTISIQSGKKVIGLCQIQQDNGILLLTKKKSGIRRPQDFIGKKVGVWLGSWEAQFDALLHSEGINPKKVNVVSQGWSMAPFIRDEIDVASAMIYNEYHVLMGSGIKAEQLNLIQYADYGVAFPGDVLFTSRQRHENSADLCARMLRASLRGWRYATEHQSEATDIVLKYDESGIQTRDHQLAMMKEIKRLVQPVGGKIGSTNKAKFERMVKFLVRYKMLDQSLTVNDVFARDIQSLTRLE